MIGDTLRLLIARPELVLALEYGFQRGRRQAKLLTQNRHGGGYREIDIVDQPVHLARILLQRVARLGEDRIDIVVRLFQHVRGIEQLQEIIVVGVADRFEPPKVELVQIDHEHVLLAQRRPGLGHQRITALGIECFRAGQCRHQVTDQPHVRFGV